MEHEILDQAWAAVDRQWSGFRPAFGMVLGSGWGAVAEGLGVVDTMDYDRIPGLGRTSVEGHAGRLLRVRPGVAEGLVFQGRRHWYEGEGWTPIALPVYLLKRCGASMVFLTNAAGGIRSSFSPGDFMVICDHINAMGVHPLVGPHNPFWGLRFPDQTSLYDPGLRALLGRLGEGLGIPCSDGVYLAASGPTYETPAEVRAYAAWGADAVGMSTVPEAILASAAGLRVAGLSCITNAAAGLGGSPLSHEDVGEAARAAQPRMTRLVRAFLEEAVA